MDAASTYLSLEEPDRSNHLWRYTPWKKVHPSGDLSHFPEMQKPEVRISMIDGSEVPEGISIIEGASSDIKLDFGDQLTTSFLYASTENSRWTLVVNNSFTSSVPVILDIVTGEGISAAHLSMEIGELSEIELITRVSGKSEWFGLLRTGEVGKGAFVNDVLLCLQQSGTMLRSESILIGRDAQVCAGTVSSGSERTKSDLRFKMGETGGNLKVLGSILSADRMHLDHHIEILHDAAETFSRLSWHSACGGESRTIGTGMLRVKEGSDGADAAQIFHNLLLSEKAEADSIPELEVMEHNVVGCGHGTANGPIDDGQIFYLEARGYDKKDAERALIAAFLNTTLSQMGSDALHDWLVMMLTAQLETLNP